MDIVSTTSMNHLEHEREIINRFHSRDYDENVVNVEHHQHKTTMDMFPASPFLLKNQISSRIIGNAHSYVGNEVQVIDKYMNDNSYPSKPAIIQNRAEIFERYSSLTLYKLTQTYKHVS